jgi:hypothetical protein
VSPKSHAHSVCSLPDVKSQKGEAKKIVIPAIVSKSMPLAVRTVFYCEEAKLTMVQLSLSGWHAQSLSFSTTVSAISISVLLVLMTV